MFCIKCGAKGINDAVFCGRCGAKLPHAAAAQGSLYAHQEQAPQEAKPYTPFQPTTHAFPVIDPIESIRRAWKSKFVLDGRITRSEFWWPWILLQMVGIPLLHFNPRTDNLFLIILLLSLYVLLIGVATVIGISTSVRRYHDHNLSGWWSLLPLTVIGVVPHLYFLLTKGTPGPNRFGDHPAVDTTAYPRHEGFFAFVNLLAFVALIGMSVLTVYAFKKANERNRYSDIQPVAIEAPSIDEDETLWGRDDTSGTQPSPEIQTNTEKRDEAELDRYMQDNTQPILTQPQVEPDPEPTPPQEPVQGDTDPAL